MLVLFLCVCVVGWICRGSGQLCQSPLIAMIIYVCHDFCDPKRGFPLVLPVKDVYQQLDRERMENCGVPGVPLDFNLSYQP